MAIREIESVRVYGMATLRQNKTGIQCFIELRPQPDATHKQATIKLRLKDADFKTGDMTDTAHITVGPEPKQFKSSLVLSRKLWSQLAKWIRLNQDPIERYWFDSANYTTSDLFDDLKKL